MSRSTAEMVPNPMMMLLRLLPKRKVVISNTLTAMMMPLMTCTKPSMGFSFDDSNEL